MAFPLLLAGPIVRRVLGAVGAGVGCAVARGQPTGRPSPGSPAGARAAARSAAASASISSTGRPHSRVGPGTSPRSELLPQPMIEGETDELVLEPAGVGDVDDPAPEW